MSERREEFAVETTLADMYRERFPEQADAERLALWREIAAYLQRYVPNDARVLDIACDRGYLIRGLRGGEKVATDLRDVSAHLPPPIRFVRSDGLSLAGVLPPGYFDVITMSNYLEHLPSGAAVIEQLRVCLGLLRPGGRVIILQPNIRLTKGAYWDFIDHKTPLTEKSLVEAANLAGFTTQVLVTRFFPYTTKSRVPKAASLVRLYLRMPLVWRLLGRQTLYVGAKPLEERQGKRFTVESESSTSSGRSAQRPSPLGQMR